MLVTYGAASSSAHRCRRRRGARRRRADRAVLPVFGDWPGELADRFERARLLQILKAAELAAVLRRGGGAVDRQPRAVASCALFVLGAQATFSSPVRYALLPQHLAADELVDGNALMEGGTFLSILFGTIAGGLAVALDSGHRAAGLLLILCARRRALRRASSCRARRRPRPSCASAATRCRDRPRSCAMPGSGATSGCRSSAARGSGWSARCSCRSSRPSRKTTLGAGSGVVTLFLAAFSIGVGVGSVLCGRLMRGEVSARYVPLAALGMALFSLDLALASEGAVPPLGGELLGIAAFLSRLVGHAHLRRPAGDRDLRRHLRRAALRDHPAAQRRGGAGPHHRRQQHHERAVHDRRRARHRAAARRRARIPPTSTSCSASSTPAVALWICRLLPQDTLRMLARIVLRLAYRVELRGLENLAAAGERVVIVPNHVSYLDGPLIAAFLPGLPMFAIDTAQAARWWVRPLLAGADIFPMDPTRPMATKSLVKALREGRQCVIFPEGRLNVTGGALDENL